MFEVLPETHERRFFVKVSGKLTDADYKELLPRLDKAIADHGRLNMFIDMEEFEAIELRAAWDDFAFGIKHWNDFERVAMVGDKGWQELLVKTFDPFIKGDFRHFEIADKGAAQAWIEGT